ncbi:hypothetical protein BU24DRAFT_411185 [Aaosphaeria arxii CBS 175.79]|uniref:DUF6594 domain-containing protein n=1 Tax=Aaosphaeria arxii CBS 175.79 TaxID=1450172 RepID=A0A6A5XJJ4_9PLEO|nr:uncharacterized protein BU24DRAFT_411185 [Aaosphaeria arxii CBS 175.79]KAF2013448.1 hypothetical protein BU24DRAFT_411185 [Aaosphaeria arxii CBS 175.79]
MPDIENAESLLELHEKFYKNVANYPAIPKFRLFGAQWAKRLHDHVAEVLERQKAVDEALVCLSVNGSKSLTTFTCPRRDVRKKIKENKDGLGLLWQRVENAWKEYDGSLREYAQDLCLVGEIYRLPAQHPYFGEFLTYYRSLFDKSGVYRPTGESSKDYEDKTAEDFCSILDTGKNDVLTNFYINHSKWFENHIWSFFRRGAAKGTMETSVGLDTIRMTVDFIVCTFIPILMMVTMFVLTSIRSLKPRIAVSGGIGWVFAFAAIVLSQQHSRSEMFNYTAAFFAVVAVFVGVTTDSTR